jgi:GDP-L-fucose synthase
MSGSTTHGTAWLQDAKVWIAGHTGLAGSAITRRFTEHGVGALITRRSADLDLLDQQATWSFLEDQRPDVIVMAAGTVGGIAANVAAPGTFLYENLVMNANVVEGARRVGVRKLVLLGSSCVYPRAAAQPMTEDLILTGALEPTNQGYAVAKIAAMELARGYRAEHGMDAITLTPCNLYGPGDDFDSERSHVLSALLRRVHQAKLDDAAEVVVWGTGTPRREFLHVNDMADATLHLTGTYSSEGHVNVGSGTDVSIRELATLIADVVGWQGELRFDETKPDGMPRKLLDVTQLAELGWDRARPLRDGIADSYAWFLRQG